MSFAEMLRHDIHKLKIMEQVCRKQASRRSYCSNSIVEKGDNNKIWKMKIPLKTKVFAWYLRRGVILTKDNLAKRNWHGSKKCVFCQHDETITHLFFHCDFARSIWSAIQIGSTLHPPLSVAKILATG